MSIDLTGIFERMKADPSLESYELELYWEPDHDGPASIDVHGLCEFACRFDQPTLAIATPVTNRDAVLAVLNVLEAKGIKAFDEIALFAIEDGVSQFRVEDYSEPGEPVSVALAKMLVSALVSETLGDERSE